MMDFADSLGGGEGDKAGQLPMGWSVAFFGSAPSSNDLALSALAEQGSAAAGRCFVVSEQTKGRGRLGRQWTSHPGDGLYMSCVLCSDSPAYLLPSLSFVVSLAAHNMLAEQMRDASAKISLKWPNDVLVNGGKIAGILLEASSGGIVAGCGINLKNAPIDPSQKHPAVSLDQFNPQDTLPSARALAFRLVHHLAECYEVWEQKGHRAILESWKHHCMMIGANVHIQTPQGLVTGRCTGIGEEGQLILQDDAGEQKWITAGDVEIMKGQA
ncbi:MAG: biotin--[acetyl-CoA-carboxylase] ligase [Alphaproteobacteria bacterium]|nr:biotin--[acetyl-CoA-carboxylase] ligase [Alphaproteobacteria bacterium]MBL6776798.1 biotin--[acetyl-CoA-carboxylase] ligase [Alphaproteobacteria bacterium]